MVINEPTINNKHILKFGYDTALIAVYSLRKGASKVQMTCVLAIVPTLFVKLNYKVGVVVIKSRVIVNTRRHPLINSFIVTA